MKYCTRRELVLRLTFKILLSFLGFSHYTGLFFVLASNLSEANVIGLSVHVCMPPLIRFEPSDDFQIHLTEDTKTLSFRDLHEKR